MHHGKAFRTEYEKSKFLADRIALQAAAYPGVMYGARELTIGNFVSHLVREPSFLPQDHAKAWLFFYSKFIFDIKEHTSAHPIKHHEQDLRKKMMLLTCS